MAYKRTEYPVWSWSSSRKSTFSECQRRYYYNYYLSHNGWEEEASPESKQAYRLKQLTGLHLLLGSAVHQAAEKTCNTITQTGKLPDEKILINIVRDILNNAWKESINKREEWLKNPKSYSMLHEFYYGGKVLKEIVEKIKDKMQKSVPNIIKSDSVKEILKDECKIRITENMDTFELFDTPIYAIPDLVFEGPNGKWVVVDWKTGKEHSSHPNQISVYCMYIREKYGINEENILGRAEYLGTGKTLDIAISRESLKETENEIKHSIDEMKEVLLDPGNNIPREKEYYPLAKHRRLCPWCNFYEMCKTA